jgi:hypothetical protein
VKPKLVKLRQPVLLLPATSQPLPNSYGAVRSR